MSNLVILTIFISALCASDAFTPSNAAPNSPLDEFDAAAVPPKSRPTSKEKLTVVGLNEFIDLGIVPPTEEAPEESSATPFPLKFPFLAFFHSAFSPISNALLATSQRMSESLQNLSRVVAVNCRVQTKLADFFGIAEFPTIILFHSPSDYVYYKGPLNRDSVVAWVRRSIYPEIPTLASSDQLKTLFNHPVVFIAVTDNSDAALDVLRATVRYLDDGATSQEPCEVEQKLCIRVASDVAISHINYLKTPEIAKSLIGGIDRPMPAWLFYRKFDEPHSIQITADHFTVKKLTSTILVERTPMTVLLDEQTAPEILSGAAPVVFYVSRTPPKLMLNDDICADDGSVLAREALSAFLAAAKSFNRRVRFVITGTGTSLQRRVLKALSIPTAPTTEPECDWGGVYFVDKFETLPLETACSLQVNCICCAPDQQSITSFTESCLEENMAQSLRSEAIPRTQQGYVYKLVAESFSQLVPHKDKWFLVLFGVPWCGHSKEAEIEFRQAAAKASAARITDVVFAAMDASRNDVPAYVDTYPTITLYPPRGKGEVPIIYDGVRTTDAFLSFAKLAHESA